MNDKIAEHAAEVLKAIAHPVRLQIVELLQAKEMCVGDIVDALGGKQALTNQQLRTGKEIRFRFGSSEDKADTAGRNRSQPKMEDNLFTSP